MLFSILFWSCLMAQEEFFIYPDEFTIYQDYLETIGGKPSIYDTATIEATVISIKKAEVCPDDHSPFLPESKKCRIEPYPKDSGIVRVDAIHSYTRFGTQVHKLPTEIMSEEKSPDERAVTGQSGSSEIPSKHFKYKKAEYPPLVPGQEVQALFLCTTRPAIIRYAPIRAPNHDFEFMEIPADEAQRYAGSSATPHKRVFKPIPRLGDHFVFTSKIGEFPETVEKTLPGLSADSRFFAKIRFNGMLFIEEYKRRE